MESRIGKKAWAARLRKAALCALACALACALCACSSISSLQGSSQEDSQGADFDLSELMDTEEDESVKAMEAIADFSPSTESLDGLPSGFSRFSLTSAESPEIPEEQLDAIRAAISDIEDVAEVGFVFYDLDTGFGLCYDADETIYGASSFKAHYALYLCEDLEEGGLAELSSTDESLVESAILYSDNDAYSTLRNEYDYVDFDSWVTGVGADDAVIVEGSHYPWYCAESSAKLWTEMYLYLQTGSDDAQWLEGLLSNTTTSFLRDAISDTGAEVWNKAGWCAGSEHKYDSTTDAGIVEIDGETYVLCIMTSMPYSDSAVELYGALADAVFDVRGSLTADAL